MDAQGIIRAFPTGCPNSIDNWKNKCNNSGYYEQYYSQTKQKNERDADQCINNDAELKIHNGFTVLIHLKYLISLTCPK